MSLSSGLMSASADLPDIGHDLRRNWRWKWPEATARLKDAFTEARLALDVAPPIPRSSVYSDHKDIRRADVTMCPCFILGHCPFRMECPWPHPQGVSPQTSTLGLQYAKANLSDEMFVDFHLYQYHDAYCVLTRLIAVASPCLSKLVDGLPGVRLELQGHRIEQVRRSTEHPALRVSSNVAFHIGPFIVALQRVARHLARVQADFETFCRSRAPLLKPLDHHPMRWLRPPTHAIIGMSHNVVDAVLPLAVLLPPPPVPAVCFAKHCGGRQSGIVPIFSEVPDPLAAIAVTHASLRIQSKPEKHSIRAALLKEYDLLCASVAECLSFPRKMLLMAPCFGGDGLVMPLDIHLSALYCQITDPALRGKLKGSWSDSSSGSPSGAQGSAVGPIPRASSEAGSRLIEDSRVSATLPKSKARPPSPPLDAARATRRRIAFSARPPAAPTPAPHVAADSGQPPAALSDTSELFGRFPS